jgi:hypothetical protein
MRRVLFCRHLSGFLIWHFLKDNYFIEISTYKKEKG